MLKKILRRVLPRHKGVEDEVAYLARMAQKHRQFFLPDQPPGTLIAIMERSTITDLMEMQLCIALINIPASLAQHFPIPYLNLPQFVVLAHKAADRKKLECGKLSLYWDEIADFTRAVVACQDPRVLAAAGADTKVLTDYSTAVGTGDSTERYWRRVVWAFGAPEADCTQFRYDLADRMDLASASFEVSRSRLRPFLLTGIAIVFNNLGRELAKQAADTGNASEGDTAPSGA